VAHLASNWYELGAMLLEKEQEAHQVILMHNDDWLCLVVFLAVQSVRTFHLA